MDNDRKNRVKKAIEGFYKRQEPRATGRKNNDPEAQLVKAIISHLTALKWNVQWYESKAVYNPKAQRYMSSQMKPGHSDIAGSTPEGISCYIEVKDKGKRSTLRDNQRAFLEEKIRSNCFAVCVDYIGSVEALYFTWKNMKNRNFAQSFLLRELPIKKETVDDLTFWD